MANPPQPASPASRPATSTRQLSAAEQDARQAGADAAAVVIYAQLRAGMPADRIEQSAERVLAGQAASPTPAAAAFYAAYAEVTRTYAAAARAFGLDPAAPAETRAGQR